MNRKGILGFVLASVLGCLVGWIYIKMHWFMWLVDDDDVVVYLSDNCGYSMKLLDEMASSDVLSDVVVVPVSDDSIRVCELFIGEMTDRGYFWLSMMDRKDVCGGIARESTKRVMENAGGLVPSWSLGDGSEFDKGWMGAKDKISAMVTL